VLLAGLAAVAGCGPTAGEAPPARVGLTSTAAASAAATETETKNESATRAEPETRGPSPFPAQLAALHLRCADRGCREGVGLIVGPAGVVGPDGQPNRCTGVLVAPDRFLTAGHCLPPEARGAGRSCDGLFVAFPATDARPMEWTACARVVDAPAVRDDEVLRPDWALVELRSTVPRALVPVHAADPPPDAIVEVVAVDPHPIYRTQHAIGTRLCRVRTAAEALAIFGPDAARVGWLSDCPTVNGNSGAPVLDHEGRVRGILHGGSNRRQAIGVTTRIPAALRRR